ncbi:MAG: hypothetical protein Aurels2KO_52780 [Aureliella sp.]
MLIKENNLAIAVQVTDVSPNGVGLVCHCDPELAVGETIRLQIFGHNVSGSVVRTAAVEKGVQVGVRLSSADGMLLA